MIAYAPSQRWPRDLQSQKFANKEARLPLGSFRFDLFGEVCQFLRELSEVCGLRRQLKDSLRLSRLLTSIVKPKSINVVGDVETTGRHSEVILLRD